MAANNVESKSKVFLNQAPDFIGIGAPRTGTTWLFEILKSHPQIFLPHEKALNFFNANWERGVQWYYNQFKGRSTSIQGEISPLYFGQARLAERLHEVAPKAKLILIYREPVERLESHVKLINNMRGTEMAPHLVIQKHPILLEHGRYHHYLSELLKYFRKDQILVLAHQKIAQDPRGVYRQLSDFLGFDVAHVPPKLDTKVGRNIKPRSRKLEQLRKRTHQTLTRYGFANVIWLIKRLGLTERLRNLNDAGAKDTPPSSLDVYQEHRAFYQEDQEKFFKEFGTIWQLDSESNNSPVR